MRIAVIGGGAAGFFGAIASARYNHDAEIILFEKSHKLLSKVLVSGGGRCNVTHACFDNNKLLRYYPRGHKELKPCFAYFSTNQTIDWFESRGVKLKAEADGRMFPVTDNSQTVADCLIREARVLGVSIKTNTNIISLEKKGEFWKLKSSEGDELLADKVLVTAGGFSKPEAYQWLSDLGVQIVPPVPSLFTFNIPDFKLKGLEGVSVQDVHVKIEGTKIEQDGPVLVTHWGLSGPGILKLSAWAARELHESNYRFSVLVNFVGDIKEDDLREVLMHQKEENAKQKIINHPMFQLPKRLWERLCDVAGIFEHRWMDVSNKQINKLLEELLRGKYNVEGKTRFKEEFVTAGGVDLKQINLMTMEHLTLKGLHFAGEVLNIDGVTGGFNFQAAWTTGYLAGKGMSV